MGKSVSGALWLDAELTSPYQFRQYWVQLPDADVERFLLQLTLRPVEGIRAIVSEHLAAPERRLGQKTLAHDVTALVHGEAAARAAAEAADILFGSDPTIASPEALAVVAAEVPCVELPADIAGVRVHDLLVGAGVASSMSEVNRLLAQGAVRVGTRVLDREGTLATSDLLAGGIVLLRKGKRDFVVGKTSSAG
jgi:tyrosyl-tRNA synthetase